MLAQLLTDVQDPLENEPRYIGEDPYTNCSIASLKTQALPFRAGAHFDGMELGKRIKAKMKAKKITAKAMAEACGVTPSAVSSWFRTSRIGKGTLAKVASVLDEDLETLITGEEDAFDHPLIRPHKPSYEATNLATWLDRITDNQRRARIAHECMALIFREVDGPHLQPTAEPDPQSRIPHAAPRLR